MESGYLTVARDTKPWRAVGKQHEGSLKEGWHANNNHPDLWSQQHPHVMPEKPLLSASLLPCRDRVNQ